MCSKDPNNRRGWEVQLSYRHWWATPWGPWCNYFNSKLYLVHLHLFISLFLKQMTKITFPSIYLSFWLCVGSLFSAVVFVTQPFTSTHSHMVTHSLSACWVSNRIHPPTNNTEVDWVTSTCSYTCVYPPSDSSSWAQSHYQEPSWYEGALTRLINPPHPLNCCVCLRLCADTHFQCSFSLLSSCECESHSLWFLS